MIWDSIAEIDERSVTRHFASDPYWRSSVFGIEGIPRDARHRLEVLTKKAPGNYDGDADVLFWSPNQPETSTAIQVKRVKISASGLRSGLPNKLQEVKKGIQQANGLAQMGFSRVYLFIFVFIDARELNSWEISSHDLPPHLRGLIDSAISADGLHGSVGLLRCDFLQLKGQEAFVGASTLHLMRPATTVTQCAGLTQWVIKRFEE